MSGKKESEIAEAIQRYVEKPYFCPACGSPDIEAGSRDADCNVMTQEVKCIDCDFKWTDVYVLQNVRFDKEEFKKKVREHIL